MPGSALLTSSLLCFATFVAAKPFHRGHGGSHHNENLLRAHLVDTADGSPVELLKALDNGFTLKNAATNLLKPSSGKVKRQEGGSSGSSWGGWRSWGPYAATRPGNYVNDPDTNAELGQLLSTFESSFEALLNYFAEEYQPPSQTTSSTNANTVPSPTQLSTPVESQTISPAGSQPSDVVFDPFPSVQPIPPLSTQIQSPASTLTSSASPASTNTSSSYRFNPNRPDLTALYYAQSPATQQVPLPQLCSDPSIDIIILAFLSYFYSSPWPGPVVYPTLNQGSKCWGPNAAQVSAGATGMVDCVAPGFAAEVAQCQQQGKKVLLSLGGAAGYSDTDIPSEEKAVELAEVVWDLFLGGTHNATTNAIRPFGDVVLDGIDIDNENPSGAPYLPTLASHLRSLFAAHTTPTKPYYLSAAPQCPRPDTSIPIQIPQLLNSLDFIMPQFYNNPSCNLDAAGFLDSLTAWSDDISISIYISNPSSAFVDIGNGVTAPRLLIGAAASSAAAGAGGFVDVQGYKSILGRVKELGLGNLGGGMFWDGAWVELSKNGNGNGGDGFADAVREVLGSLML